MFNSGVSLLYELILNGGDVVSNRICQAGEKLHFVLWIEEKKVSGVLEPSSTLS